MNVPERIETLVSTLESSEELTEPVWRAALRAVPRHLFVPDRAWAAPYEGDGYRIDREIDFDAWIAAAYADHPIITQLDDGATDIAAGRGRYTSSLSAPGIVVEFLEILNPYDGDRVLEIGTGTGWTAALLAHRVGETNVTSIEVDKAVLNVATENVKCAGYFPRLVLGDGAKGCPDDAPYDRVHVTAGVSQVPYAWVEQTRPGGIIALPWMPEFEPGHKVALTVGRDGSASGRFLPGGASYMMLRGQRVIENAQAEDVRESKSVIDPRRIFKAGFGFDVAVAGLLPGVSAVTGQDDSFEAWLSTAESGAYVSGDDVSQYGGRNLWDELEGAFFQWIEWGSPDRARFGLRVTSDGQYVWLDTPANPVTGVRGPGS